MKLLERSRRLNYILCACIFIGVIVYTFVSTGNRDMLYFKPSDNAVVIEGPENYTINIAYSDIAEIELLRAFNRGTSAGGVEENNLCYGTFENAEYGRYELFVIPSLKAYIEITSADGKIYVINRENNGDTENYYNALKEKVGTAD